MKRLSIFSSLCNGNNTDDYAGENLNYLGFIRQLYGIRSDEIRIRNSQKALHAVPFR